MHAVADEGDHLVHKTPKPLVDWPRSDMLDTTGSTSSHCNEECAQMNAYAALAQGWMGEITARLGFKGPFPLLCIIESTR